MMLHLAPATVHMEEARDWRSTSQDRAAAHAILGNGRSAKMGWAIEDYHPAGAVGNAAAATAAKGQAVVQGQQVGVTDDSGIQDGPHVHTEWWPTGKPSSAIDPAPYLFKGNVVHKPTTPDSGNVNEPETPVENQEDDFMRVNLIKRTTDGALALTGPGIFINLSADANGYATAKRLWGYAIGNAKDANGEYVADSVLPVEWDRAGALSRRNEG